MDINKIYCCDCLKGLGGLPDNSIDCCVTSPPYFNLRDYGVEGQIGLENSPDEYIRVLVEVFAEVRRVLRPTGTLWVNIGDSYAGSGKGAARYPDSVKNTKQGTNKGSVGCAAIVKTFEGYKRKDLIGIPWMLAFGLRAAGWYLRQDIIWAKPNPMPESVQDRCTKAHEYIFLLSKSPKYYYNAAAIQEVSVAGWRGSRFDDGKNAVVHPNVGKGERQGELGFRNKRSVWVVPPAGYHNAHFATYPEELVRDCILAGAPEGGIVLDPFMGSGTTGIVARKLNRNFIGFELNTDYVDMAYARMRAELGLFL